MDKNTFFYLIKTNIRLVATILAAGRDFSVIIVFIKIIDITYIVGFIVAGLAKKLLICRTYLQFLKDYV